MPQLPRAHDLFAADTLGAGFFFEPTVLDNVTSANPSFSHEMLFGPVCGITSFETEEQAIQLANDSRYGLNGSSGPQTLVARSGWHGRCELAWLR